MQENLTSVQLQTLAKLMGKLSLLNYKVNPIGINTTNYDLNFYMDSINNLYVTFLSKTDGGGGQSIDKMYVKINGLGKETLLNNEMSILQMQNLVDTLTPITL